MSEETALTEHVARRLDAITRELRWHRRAGVTLVLLAGSLGAAAFGTTRPKNEIRATRFVLADSSGAERGSLAVEVDGSAALKLLDAGGVERLTGEVSSTQALFALREPDRKIAAKLVVEGTVPRLALSDRTGTDRLWVALRFGSPAIQFLASDGVARSGLTTINEETGIAVVSGTDGAAPGLILYDKSKKIVWSAP